MLDGEGLNGEVVDGEGLAGLEDLPISGRQALLADDVGGIPGGVEGDGEFFQEILQAAGVIAVLVGEEDGAEAGGIDPEGGEAEGELLGGEAGIDEDAGGAALEDGGVSGGAGAED